MVTELKLLYGPYHANSLIKHRPQKIHGLLNALEEENFKVTTEATYLLNRVQLFLGCKTIFKGDIRKLKFNEQPSDDLYCQLIVKTAVDFRNKCKQNKSPSKYPKISEGMRAADPKSYIKLHEYTSIASEKPKVISFEPSLLEKSSQEEEEEEEKEDFPFNVYQAPKFVPWIISSSIFLPFDFKQYIERSLESNAIVPSPASSSFSSFSSSEKSSLTLCRSCRGICPPKNHNLESIESESQGFEPEEFIADEFRNCLDGQKFSKISKTTSSRTDIKIPSDGSTSDDHFFNDSQVVNEQSKNNVTDVDGDDEVVQDIYSLEATGAEILNDLEEDPDVRKVVEEKFAMDVSDVTKKKFPDEMYSLEATGAEILDDLEEDPEVRKVVEEKLAMDVVKKEVQEEMFSSEAMNVEILYNLNEDFEVRKIEEEIFAMDEVKEEVLEEMYSSEIIKEILYDVEEDFEEEEFEVEEEETFVSDVVVKKTKLSRREERNTLSTKRQVSNDEETIQNFVPTDDKKRKSFHF